MTQVYSLSFYIVIHHHEIENLTSHRNKSIYSAIEYHPAMASGKLENLLIEM